MTRYRVVLSWMLRRPLSERVRTRQLRSCLNRDFRPLEAEFISLRFSLSVPSLSSGSWKRLVSLLWLLLLLLPSVFNGRSLQVQFSARDCFQRMAKCQILKVIAMFRTTITTDGMASVIMLSVMLSKRRRPSREGRLMQIRVLRITWIFVVAKEKE